MGDKQLEQRKHMSCGLQINYPINLQETLYNVTGDGYHFMVTNIIHPFNIRNLDQVEPLVIGRTDRVLNARDWERLIVGKLSKTFDVDNEIEHIREEEKRLLKQELGFASHLVLPAILLTLSERCNKNLAHMLYNKMQSGCSFQIWIQLAMSPYVTTHEEGEALQPWEIWNDFRRLANYDKKLGLALELPDTNNIPNHLELDRWCAEPVKALIIHTSQFLPNPHNQPVLSRVHQDVIKRFMALDVQYIIQGPANNFKYQQYQSYMHHLGKKLYDNSIVNEFSLGCEDYLQNPLQPLSEHLETSVYEIFEKDPIKYAEYQNAIKKALEDAPASLEYVVIIVVGAGRGPLVQAALNASYLTQRKVHVYAVEKNPFAINTLEARIRTEWKGLVTLMHQDMRICRPPEDADILVSELLGSFGDNELSPECLDGAQRFLKPNGVSIPQSYTSYLAPLQSTKLHNEIMNTRLMDSSIQKMYETPYVVHFVNAYQIAPSKALFTFKHPNWDEPIVNERMATLKFQAAQNCVLTGLAGYFETVLYKDVMLSTNPQTRSKNMISWFPILFPLSAPVQIREGDVIDVTFWRSESDEKVWYEWCLNSPTKSSIYNYIIFSGPVTIFGFQIYRIYQNSMSSPKLYFNIICPPCRSVYLLARMLDIKLEYQEVNIMTKSYLNELRKVNIRHTIPVLDDDGFMLTDSHAIAPYLVLKYSNNQSMYPKDLQKRGLIDQFLHYDSGVLYPLLYQTISPILFRNQFALPVSTVSRIQENYSQLNTHMKNHRWLMGDLLTIADLTCLCTTSTLDMLYPVNAKNYPNLNSYLERFKQVPYYNECNLLGLSKLAQLIQDKINTYNITTSQGRKSIQNIVDLN